MALPWCTGVGHSVSVPCGRGRELSNALDNSSSDVRPLRARVVTGALALDAAYRQACESRDVERPPAREIAPPAQPHHPYEAGIGVRLGFPGRRDEEREAAGMALNAGGAILRLVGGHVPGG